MNSIIIIGTIPPCPRCKLLTNVVSKKVEEFEVNAVVEHWDYKSKQAQKYATKKGLKAGTAKDVAKKMCMEIDAHKISTLIKKGNTDNHNEFNVYNDCNWSKALDEFLKPYEKLALKAGILMTPVLIINGKIKHWGSVPELSKIEGWLLELKNKKRVMGIIKRYTL